MDNQQKMRPIGFGFLCCGLGLLTAAIIAGPLPWLGMAIPFIGVGVVFLIRGRQAG